MYCPACEEEFASPQPDGICLTCGEELVSPPSRRATAAANRQQRPSLLRAETRRDDDDDAAATTAMAALASSMENGTAINPAALLPLVGGMGAGGNDDENGGGVDDLAGVLPPEALNPQAGTTAARPASKAALDNLNRTVLAPHSAELFDAHISLFEPRPIDDLSPCASDGNKKCLTLNAVPGEFGPLASSAVPAHPNSKPMCRRIGSPQRAAALVVCSPRTVKGGKLSPETMSEIDFLRRQRMSFIAYVERGDVTFVQKALVCQRAGRLENTNGESLCVGVIVGNASSGGNEVWPFVMQDSKKEAQTYGLNVPVVMIRKEDGARLVRWAKRRGDMNIVNDREQYTPCRMDVRSKQAQSRTCPVCTDPYVAGETVVRLPCGHVFHESCALAWLTKHNTCPFCRKELPTDDDNYERERRRREALGAAAGDVGPGGVGGHDIYG